jgi:hypothetical protein
MCAGENMVIVTKRYKKGVVEKCFPEKFETNKEKMQ